MEVTLPLYASTSLPLERESPVPVVQDADWEPGQVYTWWRRKQIIATAGNQTRFHTILSPTVYNVKLYLHTVNYGKAVEVVSGRFIN
jgi:hypothetical protein